MIDFVEYVCFVIQKCDDLRELENHLSMNGYDFGFDKNRSRLFASVEEMDYVETILHDRNIIYYVNY